MSTYWHLICLDHDPTLGSEEITQHTDDHWHRYAIELAAQRPLPNDWHEHRRDYLEGNAARFLAEHPRCRLSQESEYGDVRPVPAPSSATSKNHEPGHRVPYEVRDHRAPVEAAETSSDDEVAAVGHALQCAESFMADHSEYSTTDVLRVAARAALQHRAARSDADVREAHRRGFDAAMRSSRGEAALSDAEHRAARTSEEADRD